MVKLATSVYFFWLFVTNTKVCIFVNDACFFSNFLQTENVKSVLYMYISNQNLVYK